MMLSFLKWTSMFFHSPSKVPPSLNHMPHLCVFFHDTGTLKTWSELPLRLAGRAARTELARMVSQEQTYRAEKMYRLAKYNFSHVRSRIQVSTKGVSFFPYTGHTLILDPGLVLI